MKILTREEEEAHTRTTWEGGLLGGGTGLIIGVIGVYGASRRFQFFRELSLPLKAYVVTATTSFGGVIWADRYSRAFEKKRHTDSDYVNQSESAAAALAHAQTPWQQTKAFVSEQRYPIVFGSWVASMAIAFGLVSRSPYLTGQQKLVQARVYAQGLTLAVLIASFGLESNDMRTGKGRWETIKVLDPNDPTHQKMIEKKIHHESYQGEDQWMDMLEAQEARMKARGHGVRSKKEKEDDNKKEIEEEQAKLKKQRKDKESKRAEA